MTFALATANEILLTVGQRLRLQRLAQGLPQRELAQMAGLSLGALRKLESSGQCSLETVVRVVQSLGLVNELERLFLLERQSIAQINVSLPVEREVQTALKGQRALAAFLATRVETQQIQIFDDNNQAHRVELPTSALRLLVDILAELAEGNAVEVVPVRAELTTQEVTDMLNLSRPHLVKLLEEGALPFHRAGKHRRVRFADLMQVAGDTAGAFVLAAPGQLPEPPPWQACRQPRSSTNRTPKHASCAASTVSYAPTAHWPGWCNTTCASWPARSRTASTRRKAARAWQPAPS